MKKFALTTKLGEVITNVLCNNLQEAITTLSIIKHLDSKDLLEIFEVKEI
jgi:hypothetical protein